MRKVSQRAELAQDTIGCFLSNHAGKLANGPHTTMRRANADAIWGRVAGVAEPRYRDDDRGLMLP